VLFTGVTDGKWTLGSGFSLATVSRTDCSYELNVIANAA